MPQNPNFKPGVGKLATDRYDFQKHVDGTAFRHKAPQIDLQPAITIGAATFTDVQSILNFLSGGVSPPTVPDATTTSKGVIQLGGDLNGTSTSALAPRVSGLQGTPISSFAGLATNQVLTWNGSSWVNQAVPGSISIAGDLAGVGSTLAVPKVGGLQGFSVSNATPSPGQALVWNGSTWIPTGIPSSPTGTGFATVTSGTFDATATANVRYTGGKFQTSANLQYINAGITGDLVWAPTSTNKTLTLPNATDTLVAQNTTDALTNKTINATSNTITDTSAAVGDILAVVSGTKFTRLAKGVNGSFLGVSGGVLGYFTPSSSTPTGTGFATITAGVYDSTATANIRYTGGKLQSDTNIQFKTAGQLGDLSWPTITASRTLNLPDASDTLVARATTDILTNKTISANSNTITATSTALGDLLKSNGSSFQRFAMGTALQILRVNAGGTDLEWATSSVSSSGVNNTVQTSNGTGGFQGATNVLASTNFISIGTTPSGIGFLRVPNGSADTILGAKDNGGTDVNVISRPATNSFLFGNQTNQADVTLAGATTSIQGSAIVKIFGPSDLTNAAISVSGTGTVTMNPHAQVGVQVTTNVSGNGAVLQLFGGVTGFGSSESKFIGFGSAATPPTGTPSGGGYLYVEAGALKYKGTSGTLTVVGPADPHCKKCGRDFMHEWQNDNYGKLNTCIPCLLDALAAIGVDVDAFSDRNLT